MSYTDLYIDQGTDFINNINLNASDGTPINLTSYIFTSKIRTSYYAANATANITMTIADAANGLVTMSMTAANTSNVYPGKYVYDVKMVDSSNTTTRILEGFITVTPQATY